MADSNLIKSKPRREQPLTSGDVATRQFDVFLTEIKDAINQNLTKNNFEATVNPAVTDDQDLGYSVGSIWVNTTAGTVFTCTDATTGAANWV